MLVSMSGEDGGGVTGACPRLCANIDIGGSSETGAQFCLPVIDVISRVGQLPLVPPMQCLNSTYDTFMGRKHLYGCSASANIGHL